MKIKKSVPLIFASLLTFLSFFVSAQSNMYIKGADNIKEVNNGSVYIKSSGNKKSKPLKGIVITNGDKKTVISDSDDTDVDDGNSGETNPTIKKGVVTAAEGLNVRSGPSTSYGIIGALKRGETVNIYETKSGWHKIKYGSGYGYISSTYVSIDGSTSPEEPGTPSTPGKLKNIVLDPGHGGSDPGAIGPNGLREKDVVLNVSLKLQNILKNKGYKVTMTRTTDVYLTLQERVRISNASGADFFLSIHANSFTNPSANGTETFAYNTWSIGADIARKIQSELIKSNGLTNRGFKTENFYVLKYNNIPSALVELAFISNPSEENLLASDAFRTKSAQAIARALDSYK